MDDDPLLVDVWVRPVYMHFLRTHFWQQLLVGARSGEQEKVVNDVRRFVSRVEPHVVEPLLRQRDWRPRLAAGWYAGLRGWDQFTDRLGSLLLASEVCFAGQGYTLALACFATDAAAEHLCRYLDLWLPQVDKSYDQGWVLAALVRVDCRLRTTRAERFVQPGGLWDRYAAAQAGGSEGPFALTRAQHLFDLTVASALVALRPR